MSIDEIDDDFIRQLENKMWSVTSPISLRRERGPLVVGMGMHSPRVVLSLVARSCLRLRTLRRCYA